MYYNMITKFIFFAPVKKMFLFTLYTNYTYIIKYNFFAHFPATCSPLSHHSLQNHLHNFQFTGNSTKSENNSIQNKIRILKT